jgi:hypothetical protein
MYLNLQNLELNSGPVQDILPPQANDIFGAHLILQTGSLR